MRFNTLSDWLIWLETLHSKPIDLGLNRLTTVAKRLNLMKFPPVITVAGTNGKGSCVTFLESIYHSAGYKVGAYTSPHLVKFNERIKINTIPATDMQLCEAFAKIDNARQTISLTYFEFTTLAALLLFQQSNLDILILEVGLGGRLDAVNYVDCDVAVITSIDLDHMDYLGNTREAIAIEKAGILRAGKPAICGDFDPPQSLINAANNLNSPLLCQGQEFSYVIHNESWEWQSKEFPLRDLPIPFLPIQNAATALMAIRQLPKLPISIEHIKQGLSEAQLPGRFQVLPNQAITTILDVAHNPHAARYLANKLHNTHFGGKTFAVCGMLLDKDRKNTLVSLINAIDHWYLADLPGSRGGKAQELANILTDFEQINHATFDSILTAYQAALARATCYDRIIIFGSFHAVEPILQMTC